MAATNETERGGMVWDKWEDALVIKTAKSDLNALADKLMRTRREVRERAARLTDEAERRGNKPRMCYQCRHFGGLGTCGVEVDGLCRAKEEWAYTRAYHPHHICHLGLTA